MSTVLQVNILANSGSTGRIAEGIGQAINDRGWHSVIAYGQHANASTSNLIRIGNDFSIKEHGLESRLFDNHGMSSRHATRDFIKTIRGLQPDIIHLHNIHGYYLNYPILFDFLSNNNIPVVWTLHDCWPFTGHCAYFDYAGCERWKTGCYSHCPCKGKYPKSLLIDACEKNYRKKKRYFTSLNKLTIVPVSKWLSALVRDSFLGHYPINVIHNGIDLNVFRPVERESFAERYGLRGEKIVLGVASEWDERKGMRDFIKLRSKLSYDYTIVLVGVDESQKKTLPEGIIGITRTQNQSELVQIYSAADIFLNLTYEDNYPTTNLESMACGTPVLTYDTGGSPESVSEDTGWVVNQGDIDGVVKILNDLSKNQERNLIQRETCRKRAEGLFDKNVKFYDYIKLYEQILKD